MLEFDNCRVKIIKSRWSVDIIVNDDDNTQYHYVASADSYIADSGIWFGTAKEFEEVLDEF